LASWTYGLGRTAVLTTDAGMRWADNWTKWEGYDQLFGQLVRWSMRPTGDQGNYTVVTEAKDGKVRVIITALDQNDDLMNNLNMSASVVGPKMESESFSIEQQAPGRYVGEFDGGQAGSYFLTILPGPGKPPIRTGVNVPYSSEFRDRETNTALLEQLAGMQPKGGEKGELLDANLQLGDTSEAAQFNTFRRNLARQISSTDIWPLLVLFMSCVFFADVFVRRVNVGVDWVEPVWRKTKDFVLRREPPPEVDERLERLRHRKKEVGGQIDERRAAARFEPQVDEDVDVSVLESGGGSTETRSARPDGQQLTPDEAEEETYTSRLLKAKRDALKGRTDGPDAKK
jgi:hypothetical protein